MNSLELPPMSMFMCINIKNPFILCNCVTNEYVIRQRITICLSIFNFEQVFSLQNYYLQLRNGQYREFAIQDGGRHTSLLKYRNCAPFNGALILK